jgi:hypothetical protein
LAQITAGNPVAELSNHVRSPFAFGGWSIAKMGYRLVAAVQAEPSFAAAKASFSLCSRGFGALDEIHAFETAMT